MADISIADVTTTLPTGDGVFDVLMRSIDSHLDKQYTSGRIKGADYATVYLGALQAVLQQSIAFVIAQQQVTREDGIAAEQIAASQANTLLKQQLGDAQEAVYNRQTAGYDDEYKTNVFNTLMSLRTTGMTQEMAGLVNGTVGGANALANNILADAGITGVSNVIADVV
jgi:hypothetical protein